VVRSVLDSSAVLAAVNGEPGADVVTSLIGYSVISAVNFAEVVTKLVEQGASLDAARWTLAIFDLDVVAFDQALAEQAGALAPRTRSRGLSLGDRACLALAAREAIPAVTADRMWKELDLAVEVRLIR
jgi:ribonuclease VapC